MQLIWKQTGLSFLSRRRRRIKEEGFTLLELLGVLAILLLCSCLLLPSVFRIERHSRQLQMDKTAKALFLAAQKQLVAEEARGSLERIGSIEKGNEDKLRAKIGLCPEPKEADLSASDSFFIVYHPDAMDNPTEEIRKRLLPDGSIAEKIRSEGSYLIEYEPHTAQICTVWYSEDYFFTEEDIRKNDVNQEVHAIIGCYGRQKK